MLALDGMVSTVFLVPQSLRDSDVYPDLKDRFNPSSIIDEEVAVTQQDDALNFDREPENNAGTRWVLATSGTTGIPKLIEHTTESLTKTCKVDSQRGKDYVWGLVYDPFRFAGLQVVLQALASGSQLVFANTLPTVSEQASFMREQGVNALSATPTYWRKLLMSGETRGLTLKQITLGGEPADQTVLSALRAEFPDARIAHIYASTEAGVGFSVTDGKAGFPREYLASGVAGNQFEISESGTLLIKPENHTPRSSDGGVLVAENGFIDTGDLVELRDDRVYFLGRDSGAINVGGNKVIPEEVESVIREVKGVAEVIVKPKSSGMMGQLVTAEVQVDDDNTDKKALKQSIISHCRAHLEKFKVPALIRFVEEINYNPSGKLNRK
ncbi:fatty acid--CoA ligase family protein [Marinobacter szutsaonensis]